jgi:hypothetical protein
LLRLGDQPLDRLVLRQVAEHRAGAPPICDDSIHDAVGLRTIAAMDNDARPLARQSHGDRFADTSAASRHQGRLAVKLQIHRLKPI